MKSLPALLDTFITPSDAEVIALRFERMNAFADPAVMLLPADIVVPMLRVPLFAMLHSVPLTLNWVEPLT